MVLKLCLLLAALYGCAAPQTQTQMLRGPLEQEAARVEFETYCPRRASGTVAGEFADLGWQQLGSTGVIVDDQTALVAYHAVRCGAPVTALVVLPNGMRQPVKIVKEDSKLDVARVQAWKAPFGNFARPVIAPVSVGDRVCAVAAQPKPQRNCGVVTKIRGQTFHHTAVSNYGNSGSAIYNDNGELVGIVTSMLVRDHPEKGGSATYLYATQGILK